MRDDLSVELETNPNWHQSKNGYQDSHLMGYYMCRRYCSARWNVLIAFVFFSIQDNACKMTREEIGQDYSFRKVEVRSPFRYTFLEIDLDYQLGISLEDLRSIFHEIAMHNHVSKHRMLSWVVMILLVRCRIQL